MCYGCCHLKRIMAHIQCAQHLQLLLHQWGSKIQIKCSLLALELSYTQRDKYVCRHFEGAATMVAIIIVE